MLLAIGGGWKKRFDKIKITRMFRREALCDNMIMEASRYMPANLYEEAKKMNSIFDEFANQNETRRMVQEIRAGNQLVAEAVYALNERMTQETNAYKKRRRKQLQSWLVLQNDGFAIVKNFDNGSQEIEDLTLNLIPGFETHIIEFQGLDVPSRFVGIYFKDAGFWIIGQKDKFNGAYIFDGMVKNGVVFNSKFKNATVKELLHNYFVPRVAQCRSSIEIPALSGWFHQQFLSAETFMFREEEGLPPLPIQKKSLKEYRNEDFNAEMYFQKMKRVEDWKCRCLFMLYPVRGVLSSIMNKIGMREERFLSIVLLSDITSTELCDFFQGFSRNRLRASEPTAESILTTKDEVLILDARSDGVRSSYKQKERERKCRSFAEQIMRRELFTEDGCEVNLPVVVFSDQLSLSRYAVNLFLDEKSINSSAQECEIDIIGAVLFRFVKYCEENFSQIDTKLRKVKNSGVDHAGLVGAFDIFADFWSSYNVDIKMMADLPAQIDFGQILQDMLTLADNSIEDFITVIRLGISDFQVKERQRGMKMEDFIAYTENDLLIPVEILNQIFAKYGLKNEKRQILAELRAAGILVTDDKRSYSRQVKSGEKRIEVIQVKRDIFTRPGMVDIVDCGKEDVDD